MDDVEKFKQLQNEQFLEFQANQRQEYQQFLAEQEQKYLEFQEQQAEQFRKLFGKDYERHQDESLDNASPTSHTDQWNEKPLPVRRRGRPPRKPQNNLRSPSGESEGRNDEVNAVAPREVSPLVPLQANSGVQKRRGRPPKLPNLWVNPTGDVVRKRGRPPKLSQTSLLLENHSAVGDDEEVSGHVSNAPLHDHNYQSRQPAVAPVTPPFGLVPTQPRKRGRPRKYPRPDNATSTPAAQVVDGDAEGAVGSKPAAHQDDKRVPSVHTRSRLDILVQQAQEIIHDD